MIEILLVIVLAGHLLTTNVASAAPLFTIWLNRRSRRKKDALASTVGHRLAWWTVALYIAGMALGGVLLGLVWLQGDQRYLAALGQIPGRRYMFVAIELVFSLVLLTIYAATWNWGQRRPIWHGLLALLAATNTLYHFPPLMVVLAFVSAHAPPLGGMLDREMLRKLLVEPQVMARVAHIWIASFAVSGVFVMWLALRSVGDRDHETPACRIAILGSRLALGMTLLQLPLGIWVLLTLPEESRQGLMGGDLLGAGLLLASIFVSLGLMHNLAGIALGEVTRQAILRCVLYMALVVLLMSGTLRRTRVESLAAPTRAAASLPDTGEPLSALSFHLGPSCHGC